MPYIKSHSNYVLKKKHQLVNDGTIFERDITTIGAVNQFAPGQTPIYRSGNFIITARVGGSSMNQYNTQKWEKSVDGDTWTLSSIANMVSNDETQDDTKIVLKNDYYDFREFAYYGSLTEFFRASISDIVDRFPGELYCVPELNAYYTSGYTEDFERIDDTVVLGDGYVVSNPYGINIHSPKKPSDGKSLKYFADGGYTAYQVITGESTPTNVTSWNVSAYTGTYEETNGVKTYYKNTTIYNNGVYSLSSTTEIGKPFPCKGDKVADIEINSIALSAYIGDNDEIVYEHNSDTDDFHIRPKREPYLVDFYNECNNFQRLIMSENTSPKYKATFSVIKSNDYGYYREMQDFVFPTS